MTAFRRVGAALACLAALWHTAPASARTMQQKLDAACAGDAASLCPDSRQDPDRLKACLLRRRAEVSPACMRLVDASE